MSLRRRIYQVLDNPQTRAEKAVSVFLVVFIVLSVVALVVHERYPQLSASKRYGHWFELFEYAVLVVFASNTSYASWSRLSPINISSASTASSICWRFCRRYSDCSA